MNRTWKIAIVTALAIAIPFGIYAVVGINMLAKICYKISGYRLVSVSLKKIAFEIKMKVKNPSRLSVDVYGYNFSITVNDTEVAKVFNANKVQLKPQDSTEITIPVSFDLEKAFDKLKSQEILTLFMTRSLSKIKIGIEGKFIGELLKVPISSKVETEYTIAEIQELMKKPSEPCDA